MSQAHKNLGDAKVTIFLSQHLHANFPNVKTNVLTERGERDALRKQLERERTLRENMKINATANGGIQETKEWTYIQGVNKHVGGIQ